MAILYNDPHELLSVISANIDLWPSGKNFKGLCPFHEEKTPSFTVNPFRGTYRCFGCGEHGTLDDWPDTTWWSEQGLLDWQKRSSPSQE